MNTKVLMTISAVIMGLLGIALSFLPQEILHYLQPGNEPLLSALILQVMGALYFAFAMINWTARSNLIGGIYGRPIAIGNLTHFVVGSLALLKGYWSQQNNIVLLLLLFYGALAVSFAIVFYRHPVKSQGV